MSSLLFSWSLSWYFILCPWIPLFCHDIRLPLFSQGIEILWKLRVTIKLFECSVLIVRADSDQTWLAIVCSLKTFPTLKDVLSHDDLDQTKDWRTPFPTNFLFSRSLIPAPEYSHLDWLITNCSSAGGDSHKRCQSYRLYWRGDQKDTTRASRSLSFEKHESSSFELSLKFILTSNDEFSCFSKDKLLESRVVSFWVHLEYNLEQESMNDQKENLLEMEFANFLFDRDCHGKGQLSKSESSSMSKRSLIKFGRSKPSKSQKKFSLPVFGFVRRHSWGGTHWALILCHKLLNCHDFISLLSSLSPIPSAFWEDRIFRRIFHCRLTLLAVRTIGTIVRTSYIPDHLYPEKSI
jgi:hypothetical protein